MSKSLAVIAGAVGILAITTGSALAGSGCGGYSHGTESASVETQTASTGTTLQQTAKPEKTAN